MLKKFKSLHKEFSELRYDVPREPDPEIRYPLIKSAAGFAIFFTLVGAGTVYGGVELEMHAVSSLITNTATGDIKGLFEGVVGIPLLAVGAASSLLSYETGSLAMAGILRRDLAD